MKIYRKPEIEIVKFDIEETLCADALSGGTYEPGLEFAEDEVFYGVNPGDEGYLVEN